MISIIIIVIDCNCFLSSYLPFRTWYLQPYSIILLPKCKRQCGVRMLTNVLWCSINVGLVLLACLPVRPPRTVPTSVQTQDVIMHGSRKEERKNTEDLLLTLSEKNQWVFHIMIPRRRCRLHKTTPSEQPCALMNHGKSSITKLYHTNNFHLR